MKANKLRKMQRAIVNSKGLQQREAVRITDAQLKIRDEKWGEPNFQFWLKLINHWQPIKQ